MQSFKEYLNESKEEHLDEDTNSDFQKITRTIQKLQKDIESSTTNKNAKTVKQAYEKARGLASDLEKTVKLLHAAVRNEEF